jgi:hypothetical protein
MRSALAAWCATLAITAGGCKVAEKHEIAPDAGSDGGSDAPDAQAPETTIDDGPAMFSRVAQTTFRFSSDDPSATFECRIDREVAQPCRSPYARTLDQGSHSFSVRAIDPIGNGDDTPAERVWTIDTVAPDTMLTDGPPARDNSVMAQFSFSSGEAGVAFDCSLDNAGYLPCTSGASFGPVGDGTHSFAVHARDRAGNIDPSPAIYAWSVDTSTPDTTILAGPSGPGASKSATFTFFSPDAGAGATFQCALDGGAFSACTSPREYLGLAEGAPTFAVRVRDAVGNFDPSPADRNWTVDLTPPNTTIVDGPSGLVPTASASFSFTASEAGATFECKLDAGAFVACTSPTPFTGLAQGAHTLMVFATDTAGNADPSPTSRSWTVDTVAPDIAITAGPGNAAVTGPRVVFGFTVSDGTVTCSLDGRAVACAGSFAANLPAGPHQFSIRAADAASNVATMTRAWTVACAAPTAAGAAGLLHLDDTGQALANAVAGGVEATLGDTIAIEPGDPAPLAAARFGGGLTFTAAGSDHVAWPIALPALPELTLELWARPASPAGARDLVTSADGAVALRVTATSPTTVQFAISINEGGVTGQVRTAVSAPVAADAWHHVLASLQAPTLRLWVDGVRTEVGVELGAPPALDALRLGGDAGRAYDGALDEVWLAQTAITADEAALARYCPL